MKITTWFSFYFTNIMIMGSLIQILITPFNFSPQNAGLFGASSVVGGFAGMIFFGTCFNKAWRWSLFKNMYKTANIIIGLMTTISILLVGYSLSTKKIWFTSISYGLFGFFWMPWYVISLAFSSEVSSRVKETTASGFFFLGVNILSIVLSILSTFLLGEKHSKRSVFIILGVMAMFSTIGTIVSVTLKPIEEDRIGSVHALVTGSYAFQRSWIEKPEDHYD